MPAAEDAMTEVYQQAEPQRGDRLKPVLLGAAGGPAEQRKALTKTERPYTFPLKAGFGHLLARRQ
jgi:hypothetical protein